MNMQTESQAPTLTQSPPVTITNAAARRVWELLTQEGNYNLRLRVSISGGGCSGFQYGFAFDENLLPDDCIVPVDVKNEENEEGGEGSIELAIDALSMMYLTGAVIDYIESLQGAHFKVENPNAQTTCSCGSSFSL